MVNRQLNSGLALMELLVSFFIFCIVITGIYALLNYGFKAHLLYKNKITQQTDIEDISDQIFYDLKNIAYLIDARENKLVFWSKQGQKIAYVVQNNQIFRNGKQFSLKMNRSFYLEFDYRDAFNRPLELTNQEKILAKVKQINYIIRSKLNRRDLEIQSGVNIVN